MGNQRYFALLALAQPVAVNYFSNSAEGSPLALVFGDMRAINIFARITLNEGMDEAGVF